jgi:AraC family transcriptional regulator
VTISSEPANVLVNHLQDGTSGHVLNSQESGGVILTERTHRASQEFQRVAVRASFRVLLAGSYHERWRNQAGFFRPLTVVFQPQGAESRTEVDEDGAHIFEIELDESWQTRIGPTETLVADLYGGDLLWLGLHIYREYTRMPNPFAALAIEGLVMQMLATATRMRARARQGAPPPWLQRAIARLHGSLGENAGLNDLAKVAHVHPVHLSRMFRRFTGLTFGEYVQRLRVQFACRQLLNPSATLAGIASLAGFADQSHLTNVFRNITGLTPAVLRDLLPTFDESSHPVHCTSEAFHPTPVTVRPATAMFMLGSSRNR